MMLRWGAFLRAGRWGQQAWQALGVPTLTLHAAALAYVTLVSFVPLLALLFAGLQMVGAQVYLEPFLLQYLAPLGARKSLEVTESILGFVANLQVGVLGVVSFAFLLWAVLNLAGRVEVALNAVWAAPSPRRLWRRAVAVVALLVGVPVLIGLGVGAKALAHEWLPLRVFFDLPYFSQAADLGLQAVPVLFSLALLWGVLRFGPNVRVGWRAAAVGALVTAVGWKLTGGAFTWLVVEAKQYDHVYAGFAALILFVLWLYISWLLVLLGARLARAWQERPPAGAQPRRTRPLAQRGKR